MTRSTVATSRKARHKKFFKLAEGYYNRSKNCFSITHERVEKGLQYQYRDRKVRKREFRALWIQRINAGVREHGMVYSQFINGLKLANITLDRKSLSELAISEPAAFKAVVDQVQKALATKTKKAA